MLENIRSLVLFALLVVVIGASQAVEVGKSPYGPDDEVGLLNGITDAERKRVLNAIVSGKVYDLSVEFFLGMPGPDHHDPSQPRFTHFYPLPVAPHSREIGRYFESGETEEGIGAMEDAITMTLHHGTQIDGFTHVTYRNRIYNDFSAEEHFGLEGWSRGGVENIPPIVGHGLLIDVAAAKGTTQLEPGYSITIEDLEEALERQGTALRENSVVFIRTGLMSTWPDAVALYGSNPGLTVSSARWLVEQGAVLIGADNSSVDRTPLREQSVHVFLLVESGVNIIEQLWLEELSQDEVYEFAVIGLPLKIRGGGGSPIRVVALPL